MTSVPGPLVQVATQINLLAAQSTVVESQLGPRWSGYCSPVAATEPVGLHRGFANQRDRTTTTRSARRAEEVLRP
jgi:hypothetical protein